MAANPDFDFKIGQSYFRGRGGRGLIALAIVRWRWPVMIFGGALTGLHLAPAWLWDFAYRYMGR